MQTFRFQGLTVVDFVHPNACLLPLSILSGSFLPLPKYDVVEEFQIVFLSLFFFYCSSIVALGLAEAKHAGWKCPLNIGISGVSQTGPLHAIVYFY